MGRRNWVFAVKSKDRRGKIKWVELFKCASTEIIRHVKVKGNASPDNPENQEYWVKRRQRMGRNRWAKGSKYYVVAENQKWKCSVCGEDLLNDEELATHHIVPVKDGGTDDHWNLIHLHKTCHIQEHTKTKIQARSKA